MSSDFHSEMQAWREVFSLRRGTVVFFELLLVALISLFFVLVWQYQLLNAQFLQLTGEVEIIAELNPGLPQDQIDLIQNDLTALPEVSDVDFWPVEEVVSFIEQRVFVGYGDFLQEHQLDVPVNPLLRISLWDIRDQDLVVAQLKDRYGDHLLQVDAPAADLEGSFASQFVSTLEQVIQRFQILLVVSFIVILAFTGYMTAFVLSERSRGFHLGQVLHWSVPYTFWPALMVGFGQSFVAVVFALLVTGILLGSFVVALAGLLLGALFFLDVILVWFGRFVVVKWGIR